MAGEGSRHLARLVPGIAPGFCRAAHGRGQPPGDPPKPSIRPVLVNSPACRRRVLALAGSVPAFGLSWQTLMVHRDEPATGRSVTAAPRGSLSPWAAFGSASALPATGSCPPPALGPHLLPGHRRSPCRRAPPVPCDSLARGCLAGDPVLGRATRQGTTLFQAPHSMRPGPPPVNRPATPGRAGWRPPPTPPAPGPGRHRPPPP